MIFRRILEEDIDATRVTLMLFKAEDGSVVGRITTLAVNERSAIEMMSTAMADPPIREALAFAVQLADFKEQDVDVVDPDNLWTPDLGLLE